MGQVYEYGIGLPRPEFRLARKYYEDASWHRLAERSRLRAAAREPDPSRD